MNITLILQLAINLFLLSASVLLLFISLILWIVHLSPVRRLVYLSMFIFSCGLWFLLRNPILDIKVAYQPILEIVDVLCQYGITFFSLTYVGEFVNEWRKKIIRACQFWTLLFVGLTSLLAFTTDLKYTDSILLGAICNAIFIALMGACISWEALRKKNKDTLRLLLSAVPAMIGGLLEINNFLRGSVTPTTILFSIGFLLFMFLQVFWFVQHLQEQAKRSAKIEQELIDTKISIMLSQIQPHFLYNTLLGIKQLCDTQPKKASDALEHFAYYLRGNLYSISDTRLIPFSKELEHLQDYLYLEKMRFDQRLNVKWEIGFTDFLLPSLTLQPIAENAVRHGITKKEKGGTLIIRSELIDDTILIAIIDDGVGFDTSVALDDSRPHIGLENVKKRLEIQCGATLILYSIPGKGTEVKLSIMRKGIANENI